METVLRAIVLAAVVAVALVLALGLVNFARGNNMCSNHRLLRWRVALQFIAIFAIMTAIYFESHYRLYH